MCLPPTRCPDSLPRVAPCSTRCWSTPLASRVLLLGERIDAAEAQRIGIVNRVVAPEDFDAAVAEWSESLAKKSPVLMRMGKDAMFRQQDMAFEDALAFLRAQLTIAFSTEDIQEGVKAFFEKREPSWKGR